MALSDLTSLAVNKAIEVFDEFGREAFLLQIREIAGSLARERRAVVRFQGHRWRRSRFSPWSSGLAAEQFYRRRSDRRNCSFAG